MNLAVEQTPVSAAIAMFKPKAAHALDAYKIGHVNMGMPGEEYTYSNFTPRSLHHLQVPPKYKLNSVVWFGFRGTLKEMVGLWNETFFKRPWADIEAEYKARVGPFTGNPDFNTDHLQALHILGYLPLRIKALAEGSRVTIRVPVFTITNTDPRFYWLPNYMETWLSYESWKIMTVATISDAFRRVLLDYVEQTGSAKDFLIWQGHCFADRGMGPGTDAAKSCAGHMVSFFGTDSVASMDWLEWAGYTKPGEFYYGSVPATEHSVTCLAIEYIKRMLDEKGEWLGEKAWTDTKFQAECLFFKYLMTEVYPTGVVSLVADSFDFFRMITEGAAYLKDTIMARPVDAIGLSKVVFRPDSGDPVDVLCGTAIPVQVDVPHDAKDYSSLDEPLARVLDDLVNAGRIDYNAPGFKEEDIIFRTPSGQFFGICSIAVGEVCAERIFKPTPQMKGAVECLYDIAGGTVSDKGYKTLDSHFGLIYGDSITLERMIDINDRLMAKGFSAGNVVYGLGSYLYNCNTRDTLGLAMKATWGQVDNIGYDLQKDPATDNGVKKSAKGLLKVVKTDDKYICINGVTPEEEKEGELKIVFEDGVIYSTEVLSEIRDRLWASVSEPEIA